MNFRRRNTLLELYLNDNQLLQKFSRQVCTVGEILLFYIYEANNEFKKKSLKKVDLDERPTNNM